MNGMKMNKFTMLAIVAGLCLVAGCGGGRRTTPKVALINVSGTVTYGGTPVVEGTVNFVDDKNGQYASGKILPGGKFAMSAAAGTYTVFIEPPLVTIDQGPESPPVEDYKDAKDIPQKFRETASSTLIAQVSDGSTTFDFELKE